MKAPATLPLLVEIGCEEIPARFIEQAQQDLGERLKQALVEARLPGSRESGIGNPELPSASPLPTPGSRCQSFSTPRRLTVHVTGVLKKQPDQVEEVHGPPARIAFDAEGKPTHAAEG